MPRLGVHGRSWRRPYLDNAIFDAHCDDPEFGYRVLADEVRQGDHPEVSDRVVWRVCRDNRDRRLTTRVTSTSGSPIRAFLSWRAPGKLAVVLRMLMRCTE